MVPEYSRQRQQQPSATEKHDDMLGGVLVDHVCVQGAEFSFEVWLAESGIILLDEKIRDDGKSKKDEEFYQRHDRNLFRL